MEKAKSNAEMHECRFKHQRIRYDGRENDGRCPLCSTENDLHAALRQRDELVEALRENWDGDSEELRARIRNIRDSLLASLEPKEGG